MRAMNTAHQSRVQLITTNMFTMPQPAALAAGDAAYKPKMIW